MAKNKNNKSNKNSNERMRDTGGLADNNPMSSGNAKADPMGNSYANPTGNVSSKSNSKNCK